MNVRTRAAGASPVHRGSHRGTIGIHDHPRRSARCRSRPAWRSPTGSETNCAANTDEPDALPDTSDDAVLIREFEDQEEIVAQLEAATAGSAGATELVVGALDESGGRCRPLRRRARRRSKEIGTRHRQHSSAGDAHDALGVGEGPGTRLVPCGCTPRPARHSWH